MPVTYRRCTPQEVARYGVFWKASGSSWRRQQLAPRYPKIEKPKTWRQTVADRKAAHTRALAMPQMFPLTSDGKHARLAMRNNYHEGEGVAAKMAAARYADWLAGGRNG